MRKIIFITIIALAIVVLIKIYCGSDKQNINNIPVTVITEHEATTEPTSEPKPTSTSKPDIKVTPKPQTTETEKPIIEEKAESISYTEQDIDLLARVIWAEAGSDWLTDEHQQAVASVVINRTNDNRFPNTIEGVIYQKGQYGCVSNGMINQTPNQRAYDNARYVLENGTTIPENVVWQSQSVQGNGIYKNIQGHYFCY